MADAEIEIVARLAGSLFADNAVEMLADEAEMARLRGEIEGAVDPGLETVMIAPEYAGPQATLVYQGLDGFVEAWREWLEPYRSYSIELDEVVVGPEGRVLTLGKQRATTKMGGVELREPAAAVFTLRDDRVVRAEFHIDPGTAKRAAGVA